MSISISQRPPQGMNPEAYAQKYATENGISLDEAKQQLRAKFGDPQKPTSIFSSQESQKPNMDPDTLLSKSGLSKEEMIAKYGEPKKPEEPSSANNSVVNLLKQLVGKLTTKTTETAKSENTIKSTETAKAEDTTKTTETAKTTEVAKSTTSTSVKSTKTNITYINLAKTLGYQLTGDEAKDKAAIQERGKSLSDSFAAIKDHDSYVANMPKLMQTLGVKPSGTWQTDLSAVEQRVSKLREGSSSLDSSAINSSKLNVGYTNLAKTLGYTLTGNETTDKAAIQERGKSLSDSFAAIKDHDSYVANMPKLMQTLGVKPSGTWQTDLSAVEQKVTKFREAMNAL